MIETYREVVKLLESVMQHEIKKSMRGDLMASNYELFLQHIV